MSHRPLSGTPNEWTEVVIEQDDAIRQIVRKDPRYSRECYYFVSDALAYTVHKARENRRKEGSETLEERHHVTGQDLLEGLRELAWERFGPLAPVVFRQWGVRETIDFGRVVFNLIDAELMSKQDTDTLEDFRHGFDMDDAFERELDLKIVE
jgi:uncharacterized repeat protein (TIGR04138 family)